jgi:hypothetical protein
VRCSQKHEINRVAVLLCAAELSIRGGLLVAVERLFVASR